MNAHWEEWCRSLSLKHAVAYVHVHVPMDLLLYMYLAAIFISSSFYQLLVSVLFVSPPHTVEFLLCPFALAYDGASDLWKLALQDGYVLTLSWWVSHDPLCLWEAPAGPQDQRVSDERETSAECYYTCTGHVQCTCMHISCTCTCTCTCINKLCKYKSQGCLHIHVHVYIKLCEWLYSTLV